VIAVLVPVLARPHNAAPLAESLADTTTVPHRLVFVCSPDDREQIDACRAAGATTLIAGWQPGRGDYAQKIQLAYDLTDEPFVFTGADDLEFMSGWAREALDRMAGTGAGVCGTNDLGNPMVKAGKHSTHSLVRRSYIEGQGGTFDGIPGVLLCDLYDHQYVDTELVAVAIDRDEFVFARESRVRHKHPLWDRSVARDATYERSLAGGLRDRRLFERRRATWNRARVAA